MQESPSPSFFTDALVFLTFLDPEGRLVMLDSSIRFVVRSRVLGPRGAFENLGGCHATAMKAGDVLEVEISSIGTLRTRIVDEK
jgi:2-keto-4-pentenoate hydratase/2-oxohepta-3-ene-1,7-dioic acid hydratase in catechol pathway